MKTLAAALTFLSLNAFARAPKDTSKQAILNDLVVSASRVPEKVLRAPISIEQLKSVDARNMGAPSCFDAIENLKGVHAIAPSLGFKVMNTRGFANTTNVRFSQLIDGIDNQAPHIGAPIGNALGANDPDIDNTEVISGTASALYGMNALNGLINIRTKNPFNSEGISFQQLTGINHVGNNDKYPTQVYSTTNVRYAGVLNKRLAFKVNGSMTRGRDWVADNTTDLAATLNTSVGMTGADNPAFDEVNGYGNESSNRRTLSLNGKKYVVARTGYRETDIANYALENYKGDAGIYYRPTDSSEFTVSCKSALINTVYQRSNRFNLRDYRLNQYAVEYRNRILEFRSYATQERTGKSYNIRSLAENMDRAFKSDNNWYADFTGAFNNSVAGGASVADALRAARLSADNGRYQPGTGAYEEQKDRLITVNNWDQGAALRVRTYMWHTEGLLSWNKLFPEFFGRYGVQLMSGFDHRTYIIVPDGNYFINPTHPGKDLTYSKTGGSVQLNKDLFNSKVRLGATVRADYGQYFNWKFNPRITAVYTPRDEMNFRVAYQSGYRFPSIFEGFSNVVSGGVKRVGGLEVMSNGIFENSYTKASIDAFQSRVNSAVNTGGLTQSQAIEQEKGVLKKNPYTYLQPEYVRSLEIGFKGLALNKKLFLDADLYYNVYDNFIAQVEASVPKTNNPDSIPVYLYSGSKQDRYRLWTNSQSKITTYGSSVGMKYTYNSKFSASGSVTYSRLDNTDDKDGLEDGFNTPRFIYNLTVTGNHIRRNLGAGITCRHQTSYDYVSFLVSGTVPAYTAVDAQINYSFSRPGIVAKAGATNLLNRQYYSILGGPAIGGLYYLSLTYTMK